MRERLQRGDCCRGSSVVDFDLNKDAGSPGRPLRDAAVLVPIVLERDAPQLILTTILGPKHTTPQIAFPGGKVEPTDSGVTSAALREAKVEIGLDFEMAEVWARWRRMKR